MPRNLPVRPISDRIKQSLFDILRPRLPGSRFLDLFAGTGSVGLEALSRGAETAVFVDSDPRCLKVIEKNVDRAGWAPRAKVLRGNILSPPAWIAYRAALEMFDLVFLGPPYKDEAKRPLEYTRIVVAHLASSGLLAPDGWIVAQHHVKEPAPAPPGLERFRQCKYGDTVVSFYRRCDRPRFELSSER